MKTKPGMAMLAGTLILAASIPSITLAGGPGAGMTGGRGFQGQTQRMDMAGPGHMQNPVRDQMQNRRQSETNMKRNEMNRQDTHRSDGTDTENGGPMEMRRKGHGPAGGANGSTDGLSSDRGNRGRGAQSGADNTATSK